MQLTTRNRILDLSSPQIMGVLNVTPDSFFDGGKFNSVEAAIGRIEQMVEQGAAIIDIGGESTRPGSEPVTEQQELDRVVPVFEQAIPKFPGTLFSIDTTKYSVAEQALKMGAHFVNDISGLQEEPRFVGLCREYNAGLILMHSQGNPKTMQENPTYEDVVTDIHQFFEQQAAKAKDLDTVILDPGIGFGKTDQHNISIIKNLDKFLNLGYPLLMGASRKSTVGHLLEDRSVNDRVIGTVAVHYHAMLKGAKIIRVHDVKEAKDSILVYNALVNDLSAAGKK